MTGAVRLHLVGGFLGSGKTTAIIQACKALIAQGKRVGVVTNDQGKYLVDTAFYRLEDLPAVEVTGGCFCCNYSDLETQLLALVETVKPEVVFAESVGSCTDLVATVIKPLQQVRGPAFLPASFTVFTDIRLLRMHLQGEQLPFSDQVVYIYEQQIAEAGLLVLNKIDLLSEADQQAVFALARQHCPEKTILLQSARSPGGLTQWLEHINRDAVRLPQDSLDLDYQRYGEGEMRLAWVDEGLTITAANGNLGEIALEFVRTLLAGMESQKIAIGHLKFFLRTDTGQAAKISLTTPVNPAWEGEIPPLEGSVLTVILNARAETGAAELMQCVQSSVDAFTRGQAVNVQVSNATAFHPGFPQPAQRFP